MRYRILILVAANVDEVGHEGTGWWDGCACDSLPLLMKIPCVGVVACICRKGGVKDPEVALD